MIVKLGPARRPRLRDGVECGRDALAGVELLRPFFPRCGVGLSELWKIGLPSATNRGSWGGPGLGAGLRDVSTQARNGDCQDHARQA